MVKVVTLDAGEDKEDGFALRRNHAEDDRGTGMWFKDNRRGKGVSAPNSNTKEATDKNGESEEERCSQHNENKDNTETEKREYSVSVYGGADRLTTLTSLTVLFNTV
jgi:hypothetical protein